MTNISADEINQLATKIAEVEKYLPLHDPDKDLRSRGVRIVYRGAPEAIQEEDLNKGLEELYQPLVEKYGLDINTVLMFRDVATDWVNTVIDGEYDAGNFYDGMMRIAQNDGQFADDEEDEAQAYATAIAKADLNGLFYDILMMMAEDRDWPTNTKPTRIVN